LTTTGRMDYMNRRLENFREDASNEFKEIGISLKECNILIDACRKDLSGDISKLKKK